MMSVPPATPAHSRPRYEHREGETQVSLSDLHIRAGILAGQIKQSDADTVESRVQLDRAEKRLQSEKNALERHLAIGVELREGRAALQREAMELIGRIGEPTVAAGEGVSISVGAGGDSPPKPAGIFGDGPPPPKPQATPQSQTL